jgi:enterochelin esterase-like enzyme
MGEMGRPLSLISLIVCAVLFVAVPTAAQIVGDGGTRASSDRVELHSFHSRALRGTDHLAVYLPRGYESDQRHYPVVYFLPGLPGRDGSYNGDRVRRLGRALQAANRKAIVVAPQGARKGDSDPEWHDWGPGRNWETATAHEVVHFVDGEYRTIANRRGRALVGLSAGGYGAAIIGFHRPWVFSVVESWSGYFHPTNPDGTAPLDVGGDRENRFASVHSFVRTALAVFTRHPTFLGFYVGRDDKRFRAENDQLDSELTRARVPHEFKVYPGSHSGAFWDEHQEDWLVTATDHLSMPR